MKKSFLLSILALSLFALAWCQTSIEINKLPSYMSGNYNSGTHTLDLRWKWLTQIPDICRDYSWPILLDIWSINLWNNKIQAVNSDLSCMPYLQNLDLSYNRISQIANLDKIANLKYLQLAYNNITSISWLTNLKNLQYLDLQYNQILNFSGLSKLPSLGALKTQFNNIARKAQLSGMIEKMKNLKSLTSGSKQTVKNWINKLQNMANQLKK